MVNGRIVFVLGGAASGKSRFSCELAKGWGDDVAYIATAIPVDDEMRLKIEEHKRRRPDEWKTFEEPYDLNRIFQKVGETRIILVDCLTIYISNLLLNGKEKDSILDRIRDFVLCLREKGKMAVIVSNEVGSGIVPDNPVGRRFRDIVGCVNQMVQEMSDEVYFMVAGRGIRIK